MENNPIKIHKWLYPFSFLYGIVTNIRNQLFDWGLLHSKSYDIPIISIGNITVGGTGKTPHTEYLIELLRKEFNIAVLSRGYKRKSKGFILATDYSTASLIGDEPYQIKQKFFDIHVAVDKNRCHGIEMLCKEDITPAIDVILLDDAFQHRYVQPGLNILLTDFHRLICDDALLPAGLLRESEKGKHRANYVIVTKCPEHIMPMDYRIISKRLNLFPYQQLYFSTLKYGNLIPVFNKEKKEIPLEKLKNDKYQIVLLTGIASHGKLIHDLKQYSSDVFPLIFSDHHNFSAKNIIEVKELFDSLPTEKKIIITTEKDAARLVDHEYLDETLKENIYSLPIEIKFLQYQQDNFNQNIIGYVRKNKRNSILSKRKDAYPS